MKGQLYEACPRMVLETAIVRELYCHYSKKGHWKRIRDIINDGLHIRNLSVKQNVEHHTSWGLIQMLYGKYSLNYCCIDSLIVKNHAH